MKKVTKNKTPEVKENLNIITVDDYPELAYKFIHHLYHTDKTVALIAGRDLVEYIFDEVMDLNETSILRVNFTDDYSKNIEYLLRVTDEGCVGNLFLRMTLPVAQTVLFLVLVNCFMMKKKGIQWIS